MFLYAMTLSALSAGSLKEASPEQVEAALSRAAEDDPGLVQHLSGLVQEQVKGDQPLALTEGGWVVEIDLGSLLADQTVSAGIEEALNEEGLTLPREIELGFGLGLMPDDVARELGLLDDLGQYAELGEEILEQKANDLWWFVVGAVVLVVVEVAVVEEVAEAAYEQGYQAGYDAVHEGANGDGDYDRDGKNNRSDPDDDNDGVNDVDDQYPFDNKRDICDLCGGGSTPGFADVGDTFFFTDGPGSELLTAVTVAALEGLATSDGASGLALNNL